MKYEDWLSEVNDSLTKVLLKYPDSGHVVMPIRKHVQFALNRPELANMEKTVRDTKGRLTAAAVNYLELHDEFMPVLEKAEKYWRN